MMALKCLPYLRSLSAHLPRTPSVFPPARAPPYKISRALQRTNAACGPGCGAHRSVLGKSWSNWAIDASFDNNVTTIAPLPFVRGHFLVGDDVADVEIAFDGLRWQAQSSVEAFDQRPQPHRRREILVVDEFMQLLPCPGDILLKRLDRGDRLARDFNIAGEFRDLVMPHDLVDAFQQLALEAIAARSRGVFISRNKSGRSIGIQWMHSAGDEMAEFIVFLGLLAICFCEDEIRHGAVTPAISFASAMISVLIGAP